MNQDALRGFLQVAFFLGGCGLVSALLVPRESAEFVLSVCSALMGFALLGLILALARWLGPPPTPGP
jgi:CHASE2 domain-containing sensor protein